MFDKIKLLDKDFDKIFVPPIIINQQKIGV